MAGVTIEVTVDSGDLTFTLPAYNTGTYNATVYWGDTTSSTITSFDDADLAHTYSSAGTYEVEIQGTFPAIYFNNTAEGAKCTDIITWGSSADFDGFDYVQYAFRGTGIATAGDGPMLLNSGATIFTRAFSGCSSLTSAPSDLLANGSSFITSVFYMFNQSTALAGSPPSLANMTALTTASNYCSYTSLAGGTFPAMTNCSNVTTIDNIFYRAYDLTAVADGAYQDLTSCTNFSYAHTHNYDVQLPINAFCEPADYGTRFLNQSVNFGNFLNRSSATGTKAYIPDAWKCDFGTGTPSTTSYIGTAESESSLYNFNGVPDGTDSTYGVDWGGPSSISDPTITAVSDNTVNDGQNITITGDTLCYDSVFYLTDNSDYAASTTFVEQTLNSVTEISGDIDIDFGTLTGTAYLHALTYRDQDTGTGGYTITLNSASVPTAVSASWTNAAQLFSGNGYSIAVGNAVSLPNGPQTIYGEGYSVPFGQPVDLPNGAQTFYGTGSVIVLVPTAVSASWTNAAQLFSGNGYSIAVGNAVSLQNAAQSILAAGYTIPFGQPVSLPNGPQTFYGTGYVVSLIPTAVSAIWTNAAQLFSGNGYSIAVGNAVSLQNAAQSIFAAGYTIPFSQPVSLPNGPQTIYGEGYSVPFGQPVDLPNGAQTFYGTGYIVLNIPTSVSANWSNAAQLFDADGFSIAVGDSVNLSNGVQILNGTGFTIPVSYAVDFVNGSQIFNGTGYVVSEVPVDIIKRIVLVSSDIYFTLVSGD